VKFGKYKDKTYNDIDEDYACFLLGQTYFFDNPKYEENNNKIKDYLCNKYNLSII
jgi:hypothetical protein